MMHDFAPILFKTAENGQLTGVCQNLLKLMVNINQFYFIDWCPALSIRLSIAETKPILRWAVMKLVQMKQRLIMWTNGLHLMYLHRLKGNVDVSLILTVCSMLHSHVKAIWWRYRVNNIGKGICKVNLNLPSSVINVSLFYIYLIISVIIDLWLFLMVICIPLLNPEG